MRHLKNTFYLILSLFGMNTPYAVETFSIYDIDGKQHSLAIENSQNKWVIINYWATWCPPCIKEIPELINFHKKHKNKDAVVWGINIEEGMSDEKIVAFRQKMKIIYPVFISPSTGYTYFEPLASLPVTYFISPDGKLHKSHIGKLTLNRLEEFIKDKR